MQVIPAGSFDMGSTDDDPAAATSEKPRHRVTFAKPFAVAVHEVRRGEFARFVDATGYDAGSNCFGYESGKWSGQWDETPGRSWRNPGYPQSDDDPVVCMSWTDATRYIDWLNHATGQRYRLLSEAEWEYIALKGSPLPDAPDGLGGLSHDNANYGAEVRCCTAHVEGLDRWASTAPVGSFPADALGLHDVRGNAWELLADCYHDSYQGAPTDGSARTSACSMPDRRVLRGGGWGDPSRMLRIAYRLRNQIDARYFSRGFRLARDLD